jgi:nucleoside-diphosphate kinase
MDRTLILVKPDAFARGLTGEIITRFERKGLKLAAMQLMTVDEDTAKRHYDDHVGKPFFDGLIAFITSGPLVAMIIEGTNAVEACRQIIGATDPLQAAPGSIRADLATEMRYNLVHGADSAESAEREIGIYFGDEQLI